jgi:ketosteroid isomerase-like protein
MGEQENRATIERLSNAMKTGDVMAFGRMMVEATTDDFVEEWPQSGERIRGRDQSRALMEHYPEQTGTSPRMTMRRLSGSGDVYVVEGTIDYGDGIPVSYIGIAEMRDGRVAKMTEYFANPFEAPAWRSQYVERMEQMSV